MRKYEAQVKRGIDLLCTFKPSWLKNIDVNALRMSSCYGCVLGQLYGEFNDGMFNLESRRPKLLSEIGENWVVEYGFDLPSLPLLKEIREFQTLRNEWVRQINELHK